MCANKKEGRPVVWAPLLEIAVAMLFLRERANLLLLPEVEAGLATLGVTPLAVAGTRCGSGLVLLAPHLAGPEAVATRLPLGDMKCLTDLSVGHAG